MRPSARFFSHCFTHLDPVRDVDDLKELAYNDPKLDHAALPGPMMRVLITRVEESNSAGIIYLCQHSVFDAVFIPMFLEDFDTYLRDPKASLTRGPPYKAWADTFYNLRNSAEGKKAINWHAKRLAGIEKHREALFPPQKAPESSRMVQREFRRLD
jgi:hypothetical protein